MYYFRANKIKETDSFLLKILCLFLVLSCLMLFTIAQSEAQNAEKQKLHPRNVMLIKKGLIPPMKFFPDVPRITAGEALALYHSGKGFFIAIGGDSKIMNGGILLNDYMTFDPRKLKLPKGKIIITYCG